MDAVVSELAPTAGKQDGTQLDALRRSVAFRRKGVGPPSEVEFVTAIRGG